jgi:hypothetical protein
MTYPSELALDGDEDGGKCRATLKHQFRLNAGDDGGGGGSKTMLR